MIYKDKNGLVDTNSKHAKGWLYKSLKLAVKYMYI